MGRKAGDKLREKGYGNWSDTWDDKASAQQLRASGKYDPTSEYAKKFGKLNTDGKSRVDDEKGWSELAFDSPIKTAGEYRDLVNKWSAAGFDVRAIDMDKGYGNSNVAVRIAKGGGDKPSDPGGENPGKPPSGGGGNSGGINIDTGGDQNIGKPQPPAERPPTPLYGGVTQEINQDNDIVNTITGNNNTVTNNQDNSISQKVYGGSNRYFNYSSSPEMPVESNPGTDSTMPKMNAKDFLKDFMKDFYSDTIVI